MIRVSRTSLFTVGSAAILVTLVLSLELPRRHGERIHRAEQQVLRMMERIHELESRYQRAGGDTGRFAYLQELSDIGSEQGEGASPFRGDDLVRFGYRFRVYLPNPDGHGVPYSRRDQVHTRRAHDRFACYAWPESFGDTGRRVFVLLPDGSILATENQRRRYEGTENAPRPGAGFMAADPGSIVDPPAVKPGEDRGRGIDGQFWVRSARPLRAARHSE